MGWVVNATTGLFYTWERNPVPIYKRMGTPQGSSEQMRKILPPTGLDPRTVENVARPYTDWVITALSVRYRLNFRCYLNDFQVSNCKAPFQHYFSI